MNRRKSLSSVAFTFVTSLLAMLASIGVLSAVAQSAEWEELLPGGSLPEPRFFHSSGHDVAGNRLIIFAGAIGDFSSNMRNDVHVLSNADGTGGTPTWTKLAPTGSLPAPRVGRRAGTTRAHLEGRACERNGNRPPS